METATGTKVVGVIGGPQQDSISHDTPQPQSPPSVKIRKSTFKFFGGRKSICVLPNFFSGRGRSQRKGSSKTGVTKSQTYDGVSRGCWEDLGKSSGEVASGDFEICTSSEPQKSSQEDHGKSQSLPRQRRGLRSLFSSIRRHRKNKNVELEKHEALEMSSSFHAETVPGAMSSLSDRSDNHGDSQGEELVPDVPNQTAGSECKLPLAATECTKDVTLVPEKRKCKVELDKRKRAEEEEKGEEKQNGRQEGLTTYQKPLGAESELDRLAEQNVNVPDGEPPAASCSSENLIFGDVSSLKSFDSLTGCGDIIADQDDVSVAESSVSAERGSRNAGKRSSCFVTYQGGGEEMATPDETDADYLQSLWESETSNEVCYIPSDRGSESPSLTPDQQMSSIRATSNSSPLGCTETALTSADLLSPQSDRQESAPNSDEGYYDSATPGMEEESRERPHQERLPRDSYSGDALYELFEPDDRLISPALPPKDAHLQGDKNTTNPLYALASTGLETRTMETEEERLSKIQHALLCCEFQNLRSPSKDQLLFHDDCFYDDSSLPAVDTGQTGLREVTNQHYPQSPPRSQTVIEPVPLNRGQIQESPLFAPRADSGFSSHVTDTTRPQPQSEDQSPLLPTRGCRQSQEELMVCFSQALVDFTKNTRHYRNSTESLDGSESSSPYGPSLSALPAIVTFDVVDMENEGECEQQTELVEEEEELASPYEPFEDDGCYLQQDAFAECDQRTFDAYEQSLFLSNTWGIASLPRHLSLGRPCPPVPAPLSLNRRSRSLDTDCLEFKTSELYTSVTNYDSKGAVFSQCRTTDCSEMPLPRQPCRVTVDSWRRGHGRGFDSNSSQQETKLPHVSQSTVRPSHLPLKNNCHNPNLPGATRADGEREILFGGGDALYPCSYPPTGTQWKNRPVGVTQGVPHLRSEQSADRREITMKNRRGELEGGFTPATPKL
ncbi:APC membrane recruitment protein 1 [Rhinichthys klamathensis goyatoka]|uniref:APC membrane recruitment protein 1 n=1 Tax=Rhinichthys klamathensis goyatoka TaxID=3034132 RepID=UPI0024B5D516|nr:APC membrane recruitment protein 1 [Rhinichthys klamathensis goyatoka]